MNSISKTTVFTDVKATLERQFQCLRVNCQDERGLWAENGYVTLQVPSFSSDSSHSETGMAVKSIFGLTVAALLLLLLGLVIKKKVCRCQHRRVRIPPSTGINIAAVSYLERKKTRIRCRRRI